MTTLAATKMAPSMTVTAAATDRTMTSRTLLVVAVLERTAQRSHRGYHLASHMASRNHYDLDILPALKGRDSRSRSRGVLGGSRRAGAGRRVARAYAPWSRGLRRDRQPGQSPGKNVLRGVGVRVVVVSAGDSPEHRLALAAG